MMKWVRLVASLVATGVVPLLSFAASLNEAPSARDIQKILRNLDDVGGASGTSAPCPPGSGGPSCSGISNDFCKKIWDPPHNGNLTLTGASIHLGNSAKSGISATKRQDLEVLIQSEPRLPADLRAPVAPLLEKLKAHLGKEADEESWYRALSRIERDIRESTEDVALERAKAKDPSLRTTRNADRTYHQHETVRRELQNMNNEVLRAKYENHPNWNRVARVFDQVRNDVLAEVAALNIPEAKKSEITEKLNRLKLRLPYEDPALVSPAFGCSTDLVNAFYMPDRNVFTVCAGWFNGLQDDASMAFVIAHELTHSFDPWSQASDSMMKTELGRTLARFCGAQGAAMPCDEWARVRDGVFKPLATITEPQPPFRPLTSCLKPEDDLAPFDTAELKRFAEKQARDQMHETASSNNFSYIAQPTIRKDGKDIPNQYFFRPDRFRTVSPEVSCLKDVQLELFTQELECRGYRSAPEGGRADLFEASMKEVERMQRSINEHWYAQCGRDCDELLPLKMSRNSGEETADWMAKKALARAVARQPSLASRRQMLATAAVWMCESPGAFWGASDLTAREKKWSYQPHPDNSVRRLSLFTPEIMKLLECSPDDRIQQGNASCDL